MGNVWVNIKSIIYSYINNYASLEVITHVEVKYMLAIAWTAGREM